MGEAEYRSSGVPLFEPIGLRAEPPEPMEPTPPPPPKKPTRAELERRVKALEAEDERLRAKLSG